MATKKTKNVKKYLSLTDRQKIAKKFGVTESYVRDILRSARTNDSILEACIDVAFKNKAKKEKLLQKISQL